MIALKPPFWAEDMQGLYKKVLKGTYPKITGKFSQEIQDIVKWLLNTNSRNRPDCNELLKC